MGNNVGLRFSEFRGLSCYFKSTISIQFGCVPTA